MCGQTGQPAFTESKSTNPGFPCTRGEGPENRNGTRGLPSFVSSAPPRSEGEALLHRIFSRAGVM
jgi:hypothetical protein